MVIAVLGVILSASIDILIRDSILNPKVLDEMGANYDTVNVTKMENIEISRNNTGTIIYEKEGEVAIKGKISSDFIKQEEGLYKKGENSYIMMYSSFKDTTYIPIQEMDHYEVF